MHIVGSACIQLLSFSKGLGFLASSGCQNSYKSSSKTAHDRSFLQEILIIPYYIWPYYQPFLSFACQYLNLCNYLWKFLIAFNVSNCISILLNCKIP